MSKRETRAFRRLFNANVKGADQAVLKQLFLNLYLIVSKSSS